MPSDENETERILEGVARMYSLNLQIESDEMIINFNKKVYICYGYYPCLLKDIENRLNWLFSGVIVVERYKVHRKSGFNKLKKRRKTRISV